MGTINSKELGFLAENIASRFLISKGYEIVERNYRKPWGEIDIIAKKCSAIFFIEVKANRQSYSSGFDPEVRVNNKKMSKIIKTASLYMGDGKMTKLGWQIDIISVTFDELRKKANVKHIKNVGEDFI